LIAIFLQFKTKKRGGIPLSELACVLPHVGRVLVLIEELSNGKLLYAFVLLISP
jgi:hypothetical protein